jgi:short-subunit dehydrogenase
MPSASPRKLALITGASAGIGAAFARAYAARGYDVALVARRVERLEALGAELSARHGVQAYAIAADLSLFEAHLPVMAALADRGRHVDALVNNAGFGVAQTFTAVDWARQRDFLMTLAVTPCALAHAVIPGMVERGAGTILNIGSIAAFSPGVAGNTLYPGVKSLMVKFSEALDCEYRTKGLKITAVCPGFTETEFADKAGISDAVGGARMISQTADQVAAIALKANDAGRAVVVTGVHNKVAVFLMRRLPQGLVRRVINAAAAKYRPAESP